MPGMTGKQAFMRALPPLVLMVGGSYLLSVFMQGKYDAHDRGSGLIAKDDNRDIIRVKKKQKFDLEKEYEKMQEGLDLENFVNKRVPR